MGINFQIEPIGKIYVKSNSYSINIDKEYIAGLENIEGFSHFQIVWWGHLYDTPQERSNLVLGKLFKEGPDKIGVFATRSPIRPNPIMISTIKVDRINYKKGIIYTPYIDAENNTPVLDIKPYYLMERVKNCQVPQWSRHWPQWYEDIAGFNWREEINT